MIKGDEIVVQVEGLSGEGHCVARHEGLVCFVERAVPGDTVRARVWKVQKRFIEARAVEIIRPSELRTEPKCRHFGVCGGCTWQNLRYESQLEFKRRLVNDAFRRIGGFEDPSVLPVIGCADPYYYRNKMEFTFSTRRWRTDEEVKSGAGEDLGVYLGLHVPQRWDKVLNLEECWLQSTLSSDILRTVRDAAREWDLPVYDPDLQSGYLRHLVIRQTAHTGQVMVNLVTHADEPEIMKKLTSLLVERFPAITTIVNNITSRRSMVAVGESERTFFGPGTIEENLGGYRFRISANSFFQTNTKQAEVLYRTVKELAGIGPEDVVYDLYSGTGTIAIFLSDAAGRVIGIESVESAVADAEKNARENRIMNCYFLQGDLKDRLTRDSSWLVEHPRPTVVVTDPPRSGMHEKVVAQIVRLAPRTIVYVSCNPSTQARDAALLSKGGYALERVQPVDMFPHTDHIEAVALFRRSSGDPRVEMRRPE